MISRNLCIALGVCLCANFSSAAPAPPPSRFGVCAHLARSDEFGDMERELDLMKAAGIGWVRADFTWGTFEPKDNEFHFERFDQVVAAAEARGVKVLPILSYDSPWAGHAHENPEAWSRYVHRVVERYGKRLRHWEVWNEPNIHFWKPKPDPAQYTRLLKDTYKVIKAINPDLQVLYGGTAGIPLDYIGKTLALGAGDAFDIMAVHPYSYPQDEVESGRIAQLRELKTLLKNHDAPTRIWITETGWPTHIDGDVQRAKAYQLGLLRTAGRRMWPDRKAFRVAVVVDHKWNKTAPPAAAFARWLDAQNGFTARAVTLDQLAKLSTADTDILVGLWGEEVPVASFDNMLRFVNNGGLLVHFGGIPCYYEIPPNDPTTRKHASNRFRKALGIGWEADWTKPGLPKESTRIAPAHGVRVPELIDGPMKTTRWFTDKNLKPGDRFTPLLIARNGHQDIACAAGLYRYADHPGGVLVADLWTRRSRGVSETEQSAHLNRTIPRYLNEGVEVFFWYEFRDGGTNPEYNEHRFGLLHLDLSPKPAYHALKKLTRIHP